MKYSGSIFTLCSRFVCVHVSEYSAAFHSVCVRIVLYAEVKEIPSREVLKTDMGTL